MRLSIVAIPFSLVASSTGSILNWVKSIAKKSNRVAVDNMPPDDAQGSRKPRRKGHVVRRDTPTDDFSSSATLVGRIPRRSSPPLTVYDYLISMFPDKLERVTSYATRVNLGFVLTEEFLNKERLLESLGYADPPGAYTKWTDTVSTFNSGLAECSSIDTVHNELGWAPAVFGTEVLGGVYSIEVIPSGDAFIIELDSVPFPFAVTQASVIVQARPAPKGPINNNHPDYVIKYTNTCATQLVSRIKRVDKIEDPLREEYLILKALEGYNIAPRVVSLSLPVVLSADEWMLDDFRTLSSLFSDQPDARAKCVGYGAHIRALIQTKLGVEVHRYMRRVIHDSGEFNSITMSIALQLGLDTLIMLEKLHSTGFIHGDVHPGNIVLKKPVSEKDMPSLNQHFVIPELALIDFGAAAFFPAEIGSEVHQKPPLRLNPRLLSPWHLMGFRIGRRDDVFRILEITARLLLPNLFSNYIMRLFDRRPLDYSDLRLGKMNHDFFIDPLYHDGANPDLLAICDIYHHIQQTSCAHAMFELSEALRIVRDIPDVDARPPYEDVSLRFKIALRYIRNAVDY